MYTPVIQYRDTVEALLKLQGVVANEFPPNQYEGMADLIQQSLVKMAELEWLIGIYQSAKET